MNINNRKDTIAMNIDNITIGEARQLAAMFAQPLAHPPATTASSLIGQRVIVRAYRAGVHYGELLSVEGEIVTLRNARRLWYWQVADKLGISLSDVAAHGVSDASKICAVVETQVVIDACEIMTTTAAAQQSIGAANVYRP